MPINDKDNTNTNNNQNKSKLFFGDSLLSRDKPENRKKWGPEGIGYVNVKESVCQTGRCPHYHYKDDAQRPQATHTKIHMLIASFRDQLCPRTVHNAFARAENPFRIYIRIIEQTEPGSTKIDDAGCWDRYCQDYNTDCHQYRNNVRIFPMDSRDSKGPTDARSKLSAMVSYDYVSQGQDLTTVNLDDFCMQIDSHMDFSDMYDTELIFMHHRTQNDYAVLSTYVADISQNNQDIRVVPNLCMVTFTSTIRNWGTKECRHLQKPKLTNAMWGAGLSFHRCHAELNVPVDPYLDNVFDGEEGSRGIRFFTHGYDVYTPDRVLVTHDYHTHQGNPIVHTWGNKHNANKNAHTTTNKDKNNNNPKDWTFRQSIETLRTLVKTKGVGRVNMMLGIGGTRTKPEEIQEVDEIRKSRFGLGTKRTLEQVRNFTGIDLANREMVENKCGNLFWVPFTEDVMKIPQDSGGGEVQVHTYGVPETLARGLVGQLDDPSGIDVSFLFLKDAGGNAISSEKDPGGGTATASINRLRLGSGGSITSANAAGTTTNTSPIMVVILGGCCGILILVMLASRLGVRPKNTKHN